MNVRVRYTTIMFDVRDILGISNSEYIFCDQVFKLSVRTGWCEMNQKSLSSNVGMSDRGLRKMAERLIGINLIEQGAKGKFKTTDKWYNTAVLQEAEQSSTLEDRNKVPHIAEQSSSSKRNKVPHIAEQSSSTKENKKKTNFKNENKNNNGIKNSDPDGVDDGNLNLEGKQVKEFIPYGQKPLSEVLGQKGNHQKDSVSLKTKQTKVSTLSDIYDFNEMQFEEIAGLLYNFNQSKFLQSLIKLDLLSSENFKDAVCAFLLQATSTERIQHLTEKDLASHFQNWCNKIGKDAISEKAKQYKKTSNINNPQNAKNDAFKAYQADLNEKINKGELKREKGLEMAKQKKIELQLA